MPICGDGWIHPGESCDDGNRMEGDGCTAACTKSEMQLPYCGDGEFQPPEECDDGGRNSNIDPDACRTNCRNAFCGDGVKDSLEQCDDGNANEHDGCTWKGEISTCGNGVVEVPEECDAGGQNSNVEPNVCRTVCRKPFCGDGVVDVGEECDDANKIETDGCLSSCGLLCPEGSSEIQGRCIALTQPGDECGVWCQIVRVWDSFVSWISGIFS